MLLLLSRDQAVMLLLPHNEPDIIAMTKLRRRGDAKALGAPQTAALPALRRAHAMDVSELKGRAALPRAYLAGHFQEKPLIINRTDGVRSFTVCDLEGI